VVEVSDYPTCERTYATLRIYPESVDEKIEEILQHNAAFKTIQILGQVLKNFTGSLRGGPKRQLMEECYGLGLRVLGNIFRVAELGFPHFQLSKAAAPPGSAFTVSHGVLSGRKRNRRDNRVKRILTTW
jgi:hypothetical protein